MFTPLNDVTVELNNVLAALSDTRVWSYEEIIKDSGKKLCTNCWQIEDSLVPPIKSSDSRRSRCPEY